MVLFRRRSVNLNLTRGRFQPLPLNELACDFPFRVKWIGARNIAASRSWRGQFRAPGWSVARRERRCSRSAQRSCASPLPSACAEALEAYPGLDQHSTETLKLSLDTVPPSSPQWGHSPSLKTAESIDEHKSATQPGCASFTISRIAAEDDPPAPAPQDRHS
jgi:hypothetical protein